MPNALVVFEAESVMPQVVAELDEVLRADGFDVAHSSPDDLTMRTETSPQPDLLMVSASLGLQRVALVGQHFMVDGRMPTIISFPEDDLAALEECVEGGFDYVTPPFRRTLLRSRMNSCQERSRLSSTVEEMAALASLREYERDLHIAHEIQSGFLPENVPVPEGWEVGARFRPAKQVAGDFYDVFTIVNGRRLAFVVADVCDKGIGAALFMALIRTLLRHTAEHTGASRLVEDEFLLSVDGEGAAGSAAPLLSLGAGPLVQAILGTNRYMARNHLKQGYFATMFFGVLDPVSGVVLYINGGHNPPVVVHADGRRTLLPPTGPAVGILPDSSYTLGYVQLDQGDTLFAYTDGVVEARDIQGRLYGMPKLVDLLENDRRRDAETMLEEVDASVRHFAGHAEQSDDITMLALRRTPPAGFAGP
ncbi:PP2C family protein-serine/threonine phosphatase [Sphaerisporangium sp. NPDC051011]|uniref:PP2C family protein-serine/threonine phosphatase n=1 Tax=Sphaerisporangium sp. NPDC051011 TaxID=3155792 RepID=UPI0033D6C6AD